MGIMVIHCLRISFTLRASSAQKNKFEDVKNT